MGLLCAGMGRPQGAVEAADVHSSRFLCAKGPAGPCITLLLKQGNGMGALEPSTAQLTGVSNRLWREGKTPGCFTAGFLSEEQEFLSLSPPAGVVPPYLGDAGVECKRTQETKEPLQGVGHLFYQHCQAQEPEDKDDEEAHGAGKLGCLQEGAQHENQVDL